MAGNDWFMQISMIRKRVLVYFESSVTIFDAPEGQLAQMPNALGGDPTEWPGLTTSVAKSAAAFFALLEAKAQFLMLPKRIVTALDPSRVNLSEQIPAEPESPAGSKTLGQTIWDDSAGTVEIRIPGAIQGLARTGYVLGRKVYVEHPVDNFSVFGTIYHEITHALFDLRQFYDTDSELQALWNNGVIAYLSAKGVNGTEFTDQPGKAFSEAAAYYVGDRIRRWLTALDDLDTLSRLRLSESEASSMLQATVNAYDEPVETYGIVNDEELATPQLVPSLRDAINKKLLDGLPLTKPFDQTPLLGLHDALLRRAQASP